MIDLILSTGTNLGDRVNFLKKAKEALSHKFQLIEESPIFESPAVDYLDQPDFLNQVIHFEINESYKPNSVLELISRIEVNLGRERLIDKGPRTIDIDILFYGDEIIQSQELQIPHPRQFQRSFIICPLKTLIIFKELQQKFNFPEKFDNHCWLFKA